MRCRENPLGNLVADIFRTAYHRNSKRPQSESGPHSSGYDISLVNGGSIRSDNVVDAGPITLKDLYSFFPFEDVILPLRVTGRQVLDCLENAVSRAPAQDGGGAVIFL